MCLEFVEIARLTRHECCEHAKIHTQGRSNLVPRKMRDSGNEVRGVAETPRSHCSRARRRTTSWQNSKFVYGLAIFKVLVDYPPCNKWFIFFRVVAKIMTHLLKTTLLGQLIVQTITVTLE